LGGPKSEERGSPGVTHTPKHTRMGEKKVVKASLKTERKRERFGLQPGDGVVPRAKKGPSGTIPVCKKSQPEA